MGSGGGISGKHTLQLGHELRVGPTAEDKHNTYRLALIPLACWHIKDIRFEFESSFVLPDAVDEMQMLSQLHKDHPGAPLSLFGHADPVGNDAYNKELSGRRVRAVYALLIRREAMWEELYSKPHSLGGDVWGQKSIHTMQDALGKPRATVSKAERPLLFRLYMDFLCGDLLLTPADFLAGGADPDGKGDYQGCGEFNPLLVFSKTEAAQFAGNHKKRNEENAPNRRVLGYMFRPGSLVSPDRWPCPRSKESTAACIKRFWSDAEKRRNPSSERREFESTKDTFGCRFYHRIAVESPCERVSPAVFLINASWIDTQAFCGDHVKFQGTIDPVPPDGPVNVEVLVNGTAVADPKFAVAPKTVGGKIEGTWIAKSASAQWRTDKMTFKATLSGGSSATSTNEFTFKKRKTSGWVTLDVEHASNNGFAPSVEKHDARLENDKVHYKLKVRLTGDPFSAAKRTAAKNLIQNVWNNGFANKKFHRVNCKRGKTCDCAFDCCKAGYELTFDFVASGEHMPVEVFHTEPGEKPHRSHMGGDGGDWGDPPLSPASTYPHEVGHVLGQADEYPDGGTDASGQQPPKPAAGDENLMSTPNNQKLKIRHYRFALKFLNDKAGDTYETIQP